MVDDWIEEVATEKAPQRRLGIAGRPRPGTREEYVILEEPGPAVLLHWVGKLVPHLRRDCPHCADAPEPKPLYYVGACVYRPGLARVILELTPPCWETAAAAARSLGGWAGLRVEISRPNFVAAPRILRCHYERLMEPVPAWDHDTRLELARIWGIPVKPRVYRGEAAG